MDNARLALDATKAKVSGGAGGQGAPDEGEIHLSEAQRAEVEKKEDEFVGETEEAEKVMRQVSLRGSLRRCYTSTSAAIDLLLWCADRLAPIRTDPGHPRASAQPIRAHRRPA